MRLAIIVGHLNETNLFTLAIGLGVVAITAASEWINARIPGALMGLALASAAVMGLGLEGRGVSLLGAVSGAPPVPTLREISAYHFVGLVSLSLDHRGRRHGADGGDDAFLSVGSQ